MASRSLAGQSIAARGFFDLFYQWSRMRCRHSHRYLTRSFHFSLKRHTSEESSTDITKSTSPTSPSISDSVRQTFRSLPHSAVVITTSLPPFGYRGMTISSLTSVTLTPIPILSFNILRPSPTLSALQRNGNFLIHTLLATSDGAHIADLFSGGRRPPEEKFSQGWRSAGGRKLWDVDEIKVGDREPLEGGMGAVLPWLRGRGVNRVLHCRVTEKGYVSVGDHVVVFAKVVGVIGQEEEEGEGKDVRTLGLGYGGGKYRKTGREIKIYPRR